MRTNNRSILQIFEIHNSNQTIFNTNFFLSLQKKMINQKNDEFNTTSITTNDRIGTEIT